MIHVERAVLKVTPDNSTPGSEGRLCLQLPETMAYLVGKEFRTVGKLSTDGGIALVRSGGRQTVTPNGQIWWKNGVRDHNIRENWNVDVVYLYRNGTLLVALDTPTNDIPPVLPPHQETLFE